MKMISKKDLNTMAILQLIKIRKEIDDFIDSLELLSDPEFLKELESALEEYRKGEVEKSSLEALKKQLEI